MYLANINDYYCQIFLDIDFCLNLFWYFWNPQEALNKGTGRHAKAKVKTLKKWPNFIFAYIFSLIFYNQIDLDYCLCRSSRPEVFFKKGVLRNFAKFTGEHLRWSLFLNDRLWDWSFPSNFVKFLRTPFPPSLLKKRLWHRCFPVNFVRFLGTPFLTEHLQWLLLLMVYTIVLFQKNTNSGGGLEDISSCIEERACKDSRGQLTLYGAEVVLII